MASALMDPATAKLAVQLQLADIAELLDSLYDDKTEVSDDDARRGFEILRGELQKQLEVLEGQVLALQILKDENVNRIAFTKLLEEQKRAVTDHQLAMRLAGISVDTLDVKRSTEYAASLCGESEPDDASDAQWNLGVELYAAACPRDVADRVPLNGIRTITAGACPSKTVSKILTNGPKTDTANCVVCMENVPSSKTLTLACSPDAHTYCRTCLIDLFQNALVNTTLFPPRCCKQAIPLETCRAMLPKQLIKDFDLKVEKLATPNPTYCANASCSKFVSPRDIKAEVGTCVHCGEKTCARCKCKDHGGLCPTDPHVQLLMDVAKRSKWQQCGKCNNMVELYHGCFHMTCRCSHQFCYLCGLKWKTCKCPRWEEDYLTRTGPVVPQEEAEAPVPDRPHEHDWQRVRGPDCEECGADFLPWVMYCRGCNTSSCWRCIHNR